MNDGNQTARTVLVRSWREMWAAMRGLIHMEQVEVYEGTPDQLVQQLGKLPKTRKYRVTVTFQSPDSTDQPASRISFGMFPELQALTEEDFNDAEWRGEDIYI